MYRINNLPAYEPASTAEEPNLDALLDDVARQMAVSKLSRRPSSRFSGAYSEANSRHGRPSRVMKTTSAGNSPSVFDRRRWLRGTPTAYRHSTSEELYQSSHNELSSSRMGQDLSRTMRPITWHPISSDSFGPALDEQPPVPYFDPSQALWNNDFDTITPDGLPASYPEQYEALSAVNMPNPSPDTDLGEPVQYNFLPNNDIYIPGVEFSSPHHQFSTQTPESELYSTISYPWDFSGQYSSPYVPQVWPDYQIPPAPQVVSTAPTTPDDFLPVQRHDAMTQTIDLEPKGSLLFEQPKQEKELVALGLYDKPEERHSSDPELDEYREFMMAQLLGSAYQPQQPSGKGLKLEETFQPPENLDDEEDGASSDDENAPNEPVQPIDSPFIPQSANPPFMYTNSTPQQHFPSSGTFPPDMPVSTVATSDYGWF
ncbi:MAG: hypothetical protein M1824_003291 [Vezdaea acicularis]|nr:MAG: hypothetical protein M1824_003291 [Vezdaea acicularis]